MRFFEQGRGEKSGESANFVKNAGQDTQPYSNDGVSAFVVRHYLIISQCMVPVIFAILMRGTADRSRGDL